MDSFDHKAAKGWLLEPRTEVVGSQWPWLLRMFGMAGQVASYESSKGVVADLADEESVLRGG